MIEQEKKLTPKEKRAIDLYMVDLNKVQAFIGAGYKYKNYDVAKTLASKLFTKGNLKAEIEKRLEQENKDNAALKTKIRRKYEKLAFLTIDKFLRFGSEPVDGSKFDQSFVILKDMNDIEHEYMDCIKKIKQTNQGYEIELYSAMDAMAELRKMSGFDQPIEHKHGGYGENGEIETKVVIEYVGNED